VSALADTYERFDGTGVPRKATSNAISPAARLMHVAQAVEVLARVSSWDDAVAGVARRAGGQLDPEIVEVLRTNGSAIARGLGAASVMSLFLAEEPEPHAFVPEGRLLDIATVFARVVDLKSTFTLNHSVAVADLADGCAGALGIGGTERTAMRAAALLHDLGRLGVPNGIWDKPGAFTAAERLRAEEHAYIGDRMLRASPLLAPLADLAGAHERLDGSGYHRRVPDASTPPAARLIAVCDVYVALVSERPHRPAHKKKEAAAILANEARGGRLDRECVRVLLECVGQAQPRLRGTRSSGTSLPRRRLVPRSKRP
jgi:putative nucleotidyltransferase with HDIG domain